jgi:hypothetical protein
MSNSKGTTVATNSYKHSGTLGDLIYSLPIVRHFGGGEFYLHLNQIDWIGKHYYGADPSPFHQGRMTIKDYEFMRSFMEAQDYITKFEPLDPKTAAITHNLDRFRVPFVGHPGNYVDIYADVFGLKDATLKEMLRQTPWLTVPSPRTVEGRPVVVNRTGRWVPTERNPLYDEWKKEGIDAKAIFVGLPNEFEDFKKMSGWTDIEYHPTQTLLEVAELIAGADYFIGNQSVALSIAIGMGKEFWCEARRDLPIERNECHFPNQPQGNYF